MHIQCNIPKLNFEDADLSPMVSQGELTERLRTSEVRQQVGVLNYKENAITSPRDCTNVMTKNYETTSEQS